MGLNRCFEVLQRFAQRTQPLCPTFCRFRALRAARLRALFESNGTAAHAEASTADGGDSKGCSASSGNHGDSERHAASSGNRGDSRRHAASSGNRGDPKRHAASSGNRGNSKRHAVLSDNCGDSERNAAFPGARGEPERHAVLSGNCGDSMEHSVFPSGIGEAVATSSWSLGGAASITVPSAVGMYLPGSFKAALARSASNACNVRLQSFGFGTSTLCRWRKQSSKAASMKIGRAHV